MSACPPSPFYVLSFALCVINVQYFSTIDRKILNDIVIYRIDSRRPELKTGFKNMIFFLEFMEICLLYDATHDFSIWLETSFIQADITKTN